MAEENLHDVFQNTDFSFSAGFSDRVMSRLENDKTSELYQTTFRQMSWLSVAALVLLFAGAYLLGDNYAFELPYENWDEYILYNY